MANTKEKLSLVRKYPSLKELSTKGVIVTMPGENGTPINVRVLANPNIKPSDLRKAQKAMDLYFSKK